VKDANDWYTCTYSSAQTTYIVIIKKEMVNVKDFSTQ